MAAVLPVSNVSPDVRDVALRVLQESLTNAVKHGQRSVSVRLDQHWPQRPGEHELRIQVRNAIAAEPMSVASAGLGLAGMRQRLAAVGGRLDIQRGTGREGGEFQVTAWIPVRAEVFAGESTVKTHGGSILRKLGLRDRVQLVVFAHEHGLT